jgi:hypothetical protein
MENLCFCCRSNCESLTVSRDSGNFTEASLETSSNVSNLTDTCSLCGEALQGVRGVELAEPLETESRSDRECGLASGGGVYKCERCRGEIGTKCNSGEVAFGGVKSSADCGCGQKRRRQSTSGILDEEGSALLQILELPSKVSVGYLHPIISAMASTYYHSLR